MKIIKHSIIYPFTFSIVSVLSLAATNYHEINLTDSFRPLFAALFLAGLGFATARLFLRNWYKAGLVTFLVLLLFFTYGHAYTLLHKFSIAGIDVFRHRTLFPLWLVLILISGYLVVKKCLRPEKFTPWLNLFSIFVLIYPAFTIASELFQQGVLGSERVVKKEPGIISITASVDGPDIYYIILDGYGRQDVLERIGYDNSKFVAELRARGFYVADCSQSNYAYTEFSLASSLNYDYLDAIDALEHNSRIRLLKHGAVRAFLEARGYQTVAFPTGFPWSEWTDADYYLAPQRSWASLTDFERLALDTTMMKSFETVHSSFLSSYTIRRENTLSALKNLELFSTRDGNYFVFAHIIAPHGPYVFGPNGELGKYVDAENSEQHQHGYMDQVTFINREILNVIDCLIANSKRPPVIILQADHGPLEDVSRGMKDKLPILNAYYLPGVDSNNFYPSISPVNTFRLVLNSYFDQKFSLLEDRSYFSPFDDRGSFMLEPNTCPQAP